MRLRAVSADADYLRAGATNLAQPVAKVACLQGASRGHVLGVEIEHHRSLSEQLAQLDWESLGIGQLEARRLRAQKRMARLGRGVRTAGGFGFGGLGFGF